MIVCLFKAHNAIAHKGKEKHLWNYTNQDTWHKLSKKYHLCNKGKIQSPINIIPTITTHQEPLKFRYDEGSYNMSKTDRKVTVKSMPNKSFMIHGGKKYEYLEMHIHVPSEHSVKGIHYRMELQMVHKNHHDNRLAIASVLVKRGKYNKHIHEIISRIRTVIRNYNIPMIYPINHTHFIPKNRTYYKYNGSITTPPCTENVTWFIFDNYIEASDAQIKFITKNVTKNNRKIKELGNRVVIKNSYKGKPE